MTLKTERNEEVLIVRLEGGIDARNAHAFQSDLEAAINVEDGAVLLDGEDLAYISSAGLAVLVWVAKVLHQRDGKLAVYSLQERVRNVLETTGLDQILALHATREQALGALRG